MNAIIISRIVGAIILGVIGAFTDYRFISMFLALNPTLSLTQGAAIAIITTCFALIGFLITPYITISLCRFGKNYLKSNTPVLISGLIGLIIV